MKSLIFGSTAIKHWFPDYPHNPKDLDLITKDISKEKGVEKYYVHLLISVNPNFGISKAVAKLKAVSSRILRNEFPDLKRKPPYLWTNSKFVSTVGSVSLEVVKKYIEDQKNV